MTTSEILLTIALGLTLILWALETNRKGKKYAFRLGQMANIHDGFVAGKSDQTEHLCTIIKALREKIDTSQVWLDRQAEQLNEKNRVIADYQQIALTSIAELETLIDNLVVLEHGGIVIPKYAANTITNLRTFLEKLKNIGV
jgi:hypothetical protein